MRVLRLSVLTCLSCRAVADKRLPDCEGIETSGLAFRMHDEHPDKRLPDCEGIETVHGLLS